MPGWEPERMEWVKELFAMYQGVDEETLFENLKYFLEKIMPVCDEYHIHMAIHPDDPAWSVFGLPISCFCPSRKLFLPLFQLLPINHLSKPHPKPCHIDHNLALLPPPRSFVHDLDVLVH